MSAGRRRWQVGLVVFDLLSGDLQHDPPGNAQRRHDIPVREVLQCDLFVADGHTNSRVVHFSADGEFIRIIGGRKGPGPGQFDVPHCVTIDSRDRLLVCDQQREAQNPRVQVFNQDGTFIEQWTDIGLRTPTGITIAADDTVYIGDTSANAILVVKEGRLIDTIGSLQARPHHIALDRGTGVLYFADPVTLEEAGGLGPVERVLDPVLQDPGNPIDGGLVADHQEAIGTSPFKCDGVIGRDNLATELGVDVL